MKSATPLLDTSVILETQFGVEAELDTAGLITRGVALFFDLAIGLFTSAAITSVLVNLGYFGIGLSQIFAFVFMYLYFVGFDCLNNGQTPGKQMMGIRTVYADGTRISFYGSVVRTALLALDLLPGNGLFGAIFIAASENYQRIGDHLANTMVVHAERKSDDLNDLEETSESTGVASDLTIDLETEERRAFLSFLDRYELLSDSRREELAEILHPVLACQGEAAVQRTLSIANGIKSGS